jgi:hypothetical protein
MPECRWVRSAVEFGIEGRVVSKFTRSLTMWRKELLTQCVSANVWKQWPTNLELISSRHLVTRVSQLSVSDSISIRSWIHCSLLAGASNPVEFIQRGHDG